MKNSPF